MIVLGNRQREQVRRAMGLRAATVLASVLKLWPIVQCRSCNGFSKWLQEEP